ncbi:hypothetical protein BC332_06678 [Capsicum chinense]|nr:hypothetical protein BC332_06678 [Capsicum chinense]
MVENLCIFLPKLVHLYIGYLHKIQELPQLWKLPSLQILALRNRGGLEGYDDKFMQPSKTPSDEHFYFSSVKQLELQGINEKILKKLLCPPPHYPSPLFNLKRLTLHSVEGLATMPEDVLKNLTSLQSLSIRKCKNLVSLSTCLTHLISLESLYVQDCPMLDLSNEEAMQFQAPGHLSAFRVVWLDKLMSLPLWLRHFSATLKSIYLFKCPNFTAIPEWISDIIALNRLDIVNCIMLTSLPKGLRSLTALQTLNIFWCSSILSQRCKKEVGEDWPKIAHIPTVDIQGSRVLMVSKVSKKLIKWWGMLNYSKRYTTYHEFIRSSQSDGQTEALNKCLDMYLRCFATDKPTAWFSLLPWAEFWFNTSYQHSSKMTPFEVVYGYTPPTVVRYLKDWTSNSTVANSSCQHGATLAAIKSSLLPAQEKMKATRVKGCQEVSFAISDWVLCD